MGRVRPDLIQTFKLILYFHIIFLVQRFLVQNLLILQSETSSIFFIDLGLKHNLGIEREESTLSEKWDTQCLQLVIRGPKKLPIFCLVEHIEPIIHCNISNHVIWLSFHWFKFKHLFPLPRGHVTRGWNISLSNVGVNALHYMTPHGRI